MSHVEGLENIIANLQKAVETETAKMNNRLDNAGTFLYEAVKQRASYTDHPQWMLTHFLGSPYSQRYAENSGPHDDDSIVHIQSGSIIRDIKKVTDFGTTKSSVAVGVPSSNPHIENLMVGKPKQRPRRFIDRAFEESKDDIATILMGGSK